MSKETARLPLTSPFAMRWWWKSSHVFAAGEEKVFIDYYFKNVRQVGFVKDGVSWPSPTGFDSRFLYVHILPPNSLLISRAFDGIPYNLVNPPASNHRGGVWLLMGDGSVEFATGQIDIDIWRAKGSRYGGEG